MINQQKLEESNLSKINNLVGDSVLLQKFLLPKSETFEVTISKLNL